MDLHMNLRSHLSDGRLCLTFIRPGPTKPGGLLKLVNELPWNHKTKDYLPLSRVLVYTANDETLSLNMFNYGNEKSPPFKLEAVGSEILKYAERIQKGEFLNAKNHPRPAEYFEREQLLEYMKKCSFTYLSQANPRRFLKQRYMFSEVSGTEGMDVSIEEVRDTFRWFLIVCSVSVVFRSQLAILLIIAARNSFVRNCMIMTTRTESAISGLISLLLTRCLK